MRALMSNPHTDHSTQTVRRPPMKPFPTKDNPTAKRSLRDSAAGGVNKVQTCPNRHDKTGSASLQAAQ